MGLNTTRPGKSLTDLYAWYKKSEAKLGKQLETTNYTLYSKLGNNIQLFHDFLGNSQTVVQRRLGEKLWETIS